MTEKNFVFLLDCMKYEARYKNRAGMEVKMPGWPVAICRPPRMSIADIQLALADVCFRRGSGHDF